MCTFASCLRSYGGNVKWAIRQQKSAFVLRFRSYGGNTKFTVAITVDKKSAHLCCDLEVMVGKVGYFRAR